MPKIIVYVDRGVSGDALSQTMKSLKMELDLQTYSIKRMDAEAISKENWEKESSLFVVPGGRDCYYHSALKGEGINKIKKYVEGGGAYLGICAGAYFACNEIEFEKGCELEVCGERDLKFFPGLGRGSAYGRNRYSYQSEKGVVAAAVSWKGRPVYAYFNGGCSFVDAHTFPNVQVLGRYDDLEDSPAAIVSCSYGKGKAVLTGVHLEYSAPFLSHENGYLKQILPLLEKGEEGRRILFREVLEHLGLRLRS